MNAKLTLLRSAIGSAVIASTGVPVSAIADTPLLEEVLVTAQRREQSLQDVPISVSVISGETLAARNENEISELTKLVPGFTFAEGVRDAGKNIQIRGVGTKTQSRGVDQSVGTVIDGVVASTVATSLLDFSDVARVEVLRGPQGMLFGKNASAGILNIVTQNPTPELGWGVGVSLGELNERKINGYVSGPLMGETVTGRLSFYTNQRDGIFENIFPGVGDYNDRDEWGLRGKLLIEPNEDLSVLLSFTHAERDTQCCVASAREIVSGGLADSLGVPGGEENTVVNESETSTNNTELDIYSAEINYAIGDYTLTSITSYNESTYIDNYRAINLPVTFIPDNTGDAETKQFTQEFRITSPISDKFDYVAGLYYFRKTDVLDYERQIDLATINIAPIILSLTSFSDAELESLAAFGQARWHFSDKARISVGARYNRDDISIFQDVGFLPGTIPSNPIGTRDQDGTDEAISWRVIGEYDLTDEAMVYASVARGYKGPGVSTLVGGLDQPAIVKPEIPTNYEVGIKSLWWDNRLRFNASVYQTTFEDFQTSVTEFLGPGRISVFLANAGELETRGFEMELDAQLTEQLKVSFAMSYIDAEYVEYLGAQCYVGQSAAEGCIDGAQDLSGAPLANAPEWSYTISGDYTIPLESLPFDGFVNAYYFWQDEVQFDENNAPNTIGDAYGIANLNLGIAADDGTYSVQFFVKNLFDEFYVTWLSRNGLSNGIPVQQQLAYGFERQIGISARLSF